MYQIKALSIGKSKEPWLREALSTYEKRLTRDATISWLYIKDNTALLKALATEKKVIALDSKGKAMTSEKFSSYLLKSLVEGGGKVTFVIGGAEGLPEAIVEKHPKISLSPLTFTHQMARLILLEQIYRAIEIDKGSPYHK